MMADNGKHGRDGERRRLRVFAIHLVLYFVAAAGLFAANLAFTPGHPWIFLPVVGWGAVLAVHAAYAMGLFEPFRRQ